MTTETKSKRQLELEAAVAEAKAKRAEWEAGPGPAQLREREEARKAANAITEAARHEYAKVTAEAHVRLGILLSFSPRVYAPEFLAAFARQVGITREEAHAVPQANVNGYRRTGEELYDLALETAATKLVREDALVQAAQARYTAAGKAEAEVANHVRPLLHESNVLRRAVARAENELAEFENARWTRQQQREAAEVRLAARGGTEKAEAGRAAKEKLVKVVESGHWESKTKIDWWPPK